MKCEHAASANDSTQPNTRGCEECEAQGRRDWVALRLCLTCGHVGCCDSSPNKHASKHFATVGHPIVKSFEPSEEWAYCYVDEAFFEKLPQG